MLSTLNTEKRDEKILKNRKSCLIVLISISYFLSILFLYFGSEELYKYQTLIIGQCQVKSIDLKFLRNSYFPRWNLTICYLNQTINQILIESIGTKSDRWAWSKAKKYKINETYPCYRSRNETSIIQWNWQWNKPNQLEIISFFLFGISFFILAFGLIKLKQYYQIQLDKILLSINEQHQLI